MSIFNFQALNVNVQYYVLEPLHITAHKFTPDIKLYNL